jgi:hypothetical protein
MDPCTQKKEFIVFQKYFARDKAAWSFGHRSKLDDIIYFRYILDDIQQFYDKEGYEHL